MLCGAILAICIVVFGIVSGGDDDASDQAGSDDGSPAYKLATIDAGQPADSSEVGRYQRALDRAGERCTGASESLLGDMAVVAVEELSSRGVSSSTLEVLQAMADAVPPEAAGTIECAEVAAGLVALMAP